MALNEDVTTTGSFAARRRLRLGSGMIAALLDPLIQRSASALITLGLTFVVSPANVGAYGRVVVCLTLYQACTELPMRQVGPRLWQSTAGRAFILRITLVFVVIGVVVVTAASALSAKSISQFWELMPLAVVPAMTRFELTRLPRLQLRGHWKSIARAQTGATLLSLAVCIPLLVLTKSILAASMQSAVAAVGFASAIAVMSLRETRRSLPHDRDEQTPGRQFRETAAFTSLGWAMSNADRLLLVFLAGPATLAQYTVAIALSRTASDALSMGLSAHLRSTLSLLDGYERDTHIRRTVFRTAPIVGVLAFIGAVAPLDLLAAWLLPSSWDATITPVPIFGLSALVCTISIAAAGSLIATGKSAAAARWQLVGIVSAIPIAVVASYDLVAAAALYVAREVGVLCARLYALKISPNPADTRRLAGATGAVSVLAAVLFWVSDLLR